MCLNNIQSINLLYYNDLTNKPSIFADEGKLSTVAVF